MDTSKMIFVFGSNEAGYHGAGAAYHARMNLGARMGIGFGQTGQCFAIPTKDRSIRKTLPPHIIQSYVTAFLNFASGRPDLEFQVTCLGCGLAGYKHKDIAPMFADHPANCFFDTLWADYLPDITRYWGTI